MHKDLEFTMNTTITINHDADIIETRLQVF